MITSAFATAVRRLRVSRHPPNKMLLRKGGCDPRRNTTGRAAAQSKLVGLTICEK